MEGIIVNYRLPYTKEVVIMVPEIKTRREALKLVGKKVVWIDGKKIIKGRITAAHGNSGSVRAKFSIPLPTHSLGRVVKIEE